MNFWQTLPRPILALAPMVGVTDSAFRQMSKKWGAHVVYSEMIASEALVRSIPKAIAMLDHDPFEYPLVAQLMGNDPRVLAWAARIAEARGVSGIDINFGCPAHKIARNYCGAVLMRNLDLCRRLIDATLAAVSIPVSIKVRVSINARDEHGTKTGTITINDFLEKIADLPVAAIMVHGRSFEDPFEGGIRLAMIKSVKELFTKGPVLANGGLTIIESSQDILEQTGADGLGLARSAIGRPWIFKQISQYLHTGAYDSMVWEEIKFAINEHAQCFELLRNTAPFKEIRRHLTHYISGHSHASQMRQRLVQANSALEVSQILAAY